jgi:hypothetical protein
MLATVSGSILELQSALVSTLNGEEGEIACCQRELGKLLGWVSESKAGILVRGQGLLVQDRSIEQVHDEVQAQVSLKHFFAISARTPQPVTIAVPDEDSGHQPEIYRRVARGVYIRLDLPVRRLKHHIRFQVDSPGEFVVRDVDEELFPTIEKAYFDFEPPSAAPEAKSAWQLLPVEPEQVSGPTPLILIHGMSADRWGEFMHWAANSSEAAAFREQFQLWNFVHPSVGVNAPIGFSPGYPAFEESIAAYLDRFIHTATREGVEADGTRRYFPDGPYAILAHSHGGLAARAFIKHFPERADQLLTAITLASPHMGTPWATPEWLRHTLSRMGFSLPRDLDQILEGTLAELILAGYFSTRKQSDLDMGWGNFDAEAGFGLPVHRFTVWRPRLGYVTLTLSPRDANQTAARLLPGFEDNTFEPPEPLSTYCGGLEAVTPAQRGDLHLDKFFIYAGYIDIVEDWQQLLAKARKALQSPASRTAENLGLRIANLLMGLVASPGTDAPVGAYRVGDGFVPLQSQLMLDGKNTELLYATQVILGQHVPIMPIVLREDIIAAHTLADPGRLRILPGWSHLDTITGRYDPSTGHSPLFSMIADDLLSVIPQQAAATRLLD